MSSFTDRTDWWGFSHLSNTDPAAGPCSVSFLPFLFFAVQMVTSVPLTLIAASNFDVIFSITRQVSMSIDYRHSPFVSTSTLALTVAVSTVVLFLAWDLWCRRPYLFLPEFVGESRRNLPGAHRG